MLVLSVFVVEGFSEELASSEDAKLFPEPSGKNFELVSMIIAALSLLQKLVFSFHVFLSALLRRIRVIQASS